MWLDRSSAFVLSFVARRLAESRAALIVTSRPHEDSFFDRAGLPELALGPLDDAEAVELLRPHGPGLVPAVVDRLVREAGGNPLALVELPRTLTAAQRWGTEPLPPVMPLTRRLHALFAPRVAALDAATRRLLLMAVLEGTGDVKIIQAASEGSLALLDAAARAGLIALDADGRRLVFRHPLVRATVVELTSAAARRRAHRALADALGAEPERRAWHLAEAATGPDEQVAALVEEAAYRRLRRGDAAGAIAALIRAADLSPRRADASRRLADAAYVGADVTGELGTASRLLADARQVDPEEGEGQSLHAAIASAFLLLNSDGEVDTAHQLLVAAIERAASRPERDDEGLIEALYTLSLVCHFGGRAETVGSLPCGRRASRSCCSNGDAAARPVVCRPGERFRARAERGRSSRCRPDAWRSRPVEDRANQRRGVLRRQAGGVPGAAAAAGSRRPGCGRDRVRHQRHHHAGVRLAGGGPLG